MNEEHHLPYFEEDKLFRERITKLGLALFSIGIYSHKFFNLSENQAVTAKGVALIGAMCVFAPVIKGYQEYRKLYKDEGGSEGDDNGGDWPDDDDPPPIAPNDPGGIKIEWIEDIEDFVNSQSLSSV
jgi:hypothetical protein